jgi:hypothetical protein
MQRIDVATPVLPEGEAIIPAIACWAFEGSLVRFAVTTKSYQLSLEDGANKHLLQSPPFCEFPIANLATQTSILVDCCGCRGRR